LYWGYYYGLYSQKIGEKISPHRTYVTLDNIAARTLAKSDPVLFFQTYKPPVIIDEVQYAPELFSQIKIICDESEQTGLFWLTGSQKYAMMKNVRETLAGRIGILELYSFSKNEKENIEFDNDLDFSLSCFQERQKIVPKNDVVNIFDHIWTGGMPRLFSADFEQRQEYYNSYLTRDFAEMGNVTDYWKFGKFLTACTALISQQLNFKTLSDIAEISQPTAKDWVRVLESLGIIYLLQPYANNALKRLTKTPKIYFCDTGLAAYLAMWPTSETLMNGAASGHYFENFVVMELVKHYAYSKTRANISYYRDSNAKEIDIFVEEGNNIHPFKIKKSANPDRREINKFDMIDKSLLTRGYGGIICMCEEVIPIDGENCFIPCNLL